MESLSLFGKYNKSDTIFCDESGTSYNGVRIAEDGVTILRFIDGYLDGDQYNSEGLLVQVKPAVEGPGRIEYWRKNKVHRDDNFPAIIIQTSDEVIEEYWQDGNRTK